jgi:hypothetical protein
MLDWGFPVHFTHLKNVTTFLSQKWTQLLHTGKSDVDIRYRMYMKTEPYSSILNCIIHTNARHKERQQHACVRSSLG